MIPEGSYVYSKYTTLIVSIPKGSHILLSIQNLNSNVRFLRNRLTVKFEILFIYSSKLTRMSTTGRFLPFEKRGDFLLNRYNKNK